MRAECGFNRFLDYYQKSKYHLKVKYKGSIAATNEHCSRVVIFDFEWVYTHRIGFCPFSKTKDL